MQLYLTLSMHRPKCKNIENRNLLPKNCLTPKHWLCVRSGENVWGVLPCWLLAVPPWLLMMVGKFNQSSINLHNTNDDTVRQEPASLTCQTNSGTQYTQHRRENSSLASSLAHTTTPQPLSMLKYNTMALNLICANMWKIYLHRNLKINHAKQTSNISVWLIIYDTVQMVLMTSWDHWHRWRAVSWSTWRQLTAKAKLRWL